MYVKVDFVGEHPCSVVSTAGERKIQVLQACNPKNSARGKVLRVVPNRKLPYKNNSVNYQTLRSRSHCDLWLFHL